MQDFRQPMGVATYKTADEMDPELLKVLLPKEYLQRVFEESQKRMSEFKTATLDCTLGGISEW